MVRFVILTALSLLSTACAAPASPPASSTASVGSEAFKPSKQDACFLLYNVKSGKFEKTEGGEMCRTRFPACSTFKVPLAVMAFDSGVLKNENQILKWNGVKDVRPELNHDHNAKTWMRDSVVWFSQALTPRLQESKVRDYLRRFDYGNQDMDGGLTEAWLVSPASAGPALKISAYEQVEFMKKLWSERLPVSKRSMQLTKQIMYLETSSKGIQLHGKTGSNFYDKARKIHFGWFIAHLQDAEREYIAVANLRDLEATDEPGYGGPRAKKFLKENLTALGLW